MSKDNRVFDLEERLIDFAVYRSYGADAQVVLDTVNFFKSVFLCDRLLS